MAAAIEQWGPVVEAATGKRPEAFTLLQLVLQTDELYPAGKFDPAQSTRISQRFASIPTGLLDSWTAAAGRFDSSSDKVNMLWWMSRDPKMFSATNGVVASVADSQLRRLQSLPVAAVDDWARVRGAAKLVSAFLLIRVDQLFARDSAFQADLFAQALPLAEAQLKK